MKPEAPAGAYKTFWVTRDRIDGELSLRVDVWLARPTRVMFPDFDVQWLALEPGTNESAHYGRWTVEHAISLIGPGVPDNDRECTRVGDEAEVVS